MNIVISSIANAMLRSSYVPDGFRNGRMILIDKGGNVKSVSNWRPLTMFSVIRRVIEKALDSIIRSQVKIICNQRGFVTGIPGCHINARLVNACLLNAKKFKRNCTTVFMIQRKFYVLLCATMLSKSGVIQYIKDQEPCCQQ